LIAEGDYPAFQRMIPELLHTAYDEWVDDHQKALAYRRQRNGFVEISFSPEEFDGWLKVNGEAAHMELLWVYAEEKAAGRLRMS
jgi:hypothetical protein